MRIIKKIFLILFLATLMFLGTGVVALAYFGFVPGLSEVLGASKARDLGVRYTKTDYDSFGNKLNGDIIPIADEVAPENSIIYSGSLDVNNDFSQEELSARLNYARWKYMPVKNVQIRINSDSSVEVSANVNMANLPGFIAREGMGRYTMDDVAKGLDFIKAIKVDPPVYMKFQAQIKDNKLTGNVQSLQVGRFDVPLDKVDATGAAISVFNSVISKAPTFHAKSVTFDDGKMHYEGTIPAQMQVQTE